MSCPVGAQDGTPDGATGRKRIQTACEACRVAKIRCLPSEEPGVCQKCLFSKKECVSRTGPRRRRPNKTNLDFDDKQHPPPPKPSGSFTIDIPLAQPHELLSSSSLEALRESHSIYIESLLPQDPSPTDSSPAASSPFPWMSASGGAASSGSPSSTTHSSSTSTTTTTSATVATRGSLHTVYKMQARSMFNIASAESLLATFRSMLEFCPCIILPEDVTVQELAQTRPFVLLAILAAAAGSRALQGHNLYDEEFRKVFALKLVAGGERSIELLQGILIYCLWYPFHLRPRVKQVFQYTRMASDLVHDLELDVDTRGDTAAPVAAETVTPERLDAIRAYITQYYLSSSSFAVTWQFHRTGPVPFTSWTEYCCTLLTRHAECPGDAVLASLARLAHTARDAWAVVDDGRARRNNTDMSQQLNNSLVFRGLEAQFREQQADLPPEVANTLPVRLHSLFTKFFLLGDSILRMPKFKPQSASSSLSGLSSTDDPFRPTITRLASCVLTIAQFLALFTNPGAAIPHSTLAHFSTGDWGRLILAIVVSMRLSFPLPECPEYDSAWARDQLGFEAFLDTMTNTDPLPGPPPVRHHPQKITAKGIDVASASKIVIEVVAEKYKKRLALLREQEQQRLHQQQIQEIQLPRSSKCPMLDGSMDSYFPLWNGSMGTPLNIPPLSFAEGLGDDGLLDAWADDAMNWIDAEQGNIL